MKKLFTFFVFLACFLGTKAAVVTDASIKFTECTEFKNYGWDNEAANARLSIDSEGLHFHSEEATTNNWDCQFFPLPGITDMEEGVTYTLKLKVKGSPDASIAAHLGGVDNYSAIHFTSDWEEYTIDYTCTDPKGQYGTNNMLLLQCGSFVGDFWIEYMTITHEERDQRPVTWQNILTNGDAEGEFGEPACVQSKEFGMNLDDDNQPQVHAAEIVDDGGNKVFVCHAKEVNPVIVWDSDGEQWGVEHKAGDPMPDNAWQNQFWVVLPRAAKDGEQFKLSFRYKASRAAKVSTQDHTTPGNYLGGGSYGDLNFTTEWQEYSKQFSAAGTMQSIAFNLGQEIYTEDIDFFFDDVKVEEMVLDHGLFIASANTETGTVAYDFDNAVELTWDDDQQAYAATVGKAGDKDSWVNEIMISTVRGNDKAFKAATIKATVNKPDVYVDYTEGSNGKIKLPAEGVWKIFVDTDNLQMMASQVEGDVVKEPLNPEDCINETEVIVNAVERNMSIAEAKEAGLLADPENPTDEEKELYNGQPWDNQFFLIGNRPLAVGENVYLKFEYMAETPAQVGTQNSQGAGGYLHYIGIKDAKNLDFTSEWQTFEGTVTIPKETSGNQDSWTFNLANMRGANKYHFKNFIFMTADKTENLLKEGTESLWVKEGAGTTAYEFGTNPSDGIENLVNDSKNGSNAIYNLAGQRVTKDYKGIVIKNGNKYIVK